MHIVVYDRLGLFTGVPGQVLETYHNLSRATDALNSTGETNYYATVLNGTSRYIWWANDLAEAPSANAADVASATTTEPQVFFFTGGQDGPSESTVAPQTVFAGYDCFQSVEQYEIDLVMCGKSIGGIDGSLLPNYVLSNLTQYRKDCVAFASPALDDVVNNVGNELTSILAFRNNLYNTSYQVLDTGYKYQYDNYNDNYVWVPLNGDIAGTCARTDFTNDFFWSPAGLTRGQILNIVQLAYNPPQADRDVLYPNGINPVITLPQLGTVLFGDKTLYTSTSAFSRINVRRLFIGLERAIGTMAKFELFEFNDSFTQNNFKATVNPYLAQIQGARGITDFLVVCDSTNNTPEIVDQEQFIAAMYIKPARSINFILLQFVAVATGVAFSEVILGSSIPSSTVQ
jgi:Phage tail sheath protein subtilisin-like domain/Phage tail sheath C-terminal domain